MEVRDGGAPVAAAPAPCPCQPASVTAPGLALQVTRHNFAEALPLVKQALDECQVQS